MNHEVLISGGYAVVAALALTTSFSYLVRAPHLARSRQPQVGTIVAVAATWGWLSIAVGLLALARVQSLHTQIRTAARAIAASEGWYDGRRPAQIGITIGALAISVLLIAAVLTIFIAPLTPSLRWTAVAVGGLLLLLALVIMRAVSLHQADEFFATRPPWVENAAELMPLGLIAAAGLVAIAYRPAVVSTHATERSR